MSDVAAAAAHAVRAGGDYVLVTGRPTAALQPLIDAARRHVVSAGPTTRLSVAAGVELGGHRSVAVVNPGCAFDHGYVGLAFTQSPAAAREALRNRWSVVQPATAGDVGALLDLAPRPSIVLLADVAGPDAFVTGPPAATAVRTWQDGDLATLAAAGAAVGPLVRIAARLAARGVALSAVEVAVLEHREQAPLIGGDALFVGGAHAAGAVRAGGWDTSLQRIDVADVEDADLVGSVLSHVRAA